MKQVWVQIQPWDKHLAVAAIESGADAVVVDPGVTSKVQELGRMPTVAEDGAMVLGRDVRRLDIASKSDEQKAAAVPRDVMLWLRLKDWTIIPLENLLAQRGGLMAEVQTVEQARTMLGILEKGVDGVVMAGRDPAEVRKVVGLVHGLSPQIELVTATVTRIEPSGMGDRVCIDTCSAMTIGQGMLVGNTSSAFFLVHSESLENPYVAARPFRVNASAVHAYLMRPGNKTAYLSDLRTGDDVLVVDSRGHTCVAHIGRCKVEARPMVLVFAEAKGRELSIYLQNAETINLITPDGTPVSVSRLKPGDQVLVHLEEGGRHFGMKIEETLLEH
ncbi:MAG: 3-dehydroquinate synthase II [Kiritimatiellae bacterium]|nr:3-dehydroquinate synthase II [Verrucomicrobiota bacterium]MCG2661825.1 3-dehydroquinate synthase II [Kiritimatiellia bacterium]